MTAVTAPLVTVVVLDYNYAAFVARAVESALAQTYSPLEVVVIDNGSTDESALVLAPFADRVRLVRVEHNIGQGHGYNKAVEAARGEWLIILDADDMLDPDAMETCMRLVSPGVAKVQFPLRLVDACDRPLGGVVPHVQHSGDVVPIIREFGHYAGPPGSGNLYRLSAIAPYFPVPVEDWPIGTDAVPFLLAPFHGSVAECPQPLGSYRVHQSTETRSGYFGNYDLSVADDVERNDLNRDRALDLLRTRSGIDIAGPFLSLPTPMRYRILSWRFENEHHPYPPDTRRQLMHLMRKSLRHAPGYSLRERALMTIWAAGVLYLPARASRRLVATNKPTSRSVREFFKRTDG